MELVLTHKVFYIPSAHNECMSLLVLSKKKDETTQSDLAPVSKTPTIKGEAPSITVVTLVSQPKPSIDIFDDRAGKLRSVNVRLTPTIKGEAPSITVVTLVSQPKPSIDLFDDRAGKLQSVNVRLTPTIKGEAPSIAVVTFASQPKPSIDLFDDRAGKLQ